MSVPKKNSKSTEQPRRKSIAGPLPQPTRASLVEGDGRPSTEDYFRKAAFKNAKDNTTIEGKIVLVTCVEAPADFLCCKFNEDFTQLAGGGTDGIVRIYSTDTSEAISSFSDDETTSSTASVTSIKHRSPSKTLPNSQTFTCTYVNGLVKCWNYQYKECVYTIRENRQTFGICYHPRLPKFITYGDDMKIYLYDEETKVQERILSSSEKRETHDGPTSRVFAGCFNPRSNYEFLTGGWDDVVHLWDLRAPHSVKHLSGVHICGEGLDINSKGTEILTCAWQKSDPLQVWDYSTFKVLYSIQPDLHSSKLYCGKFATTEFIACSGGEPSILRLVDLQTTSTSALIYNMANAVYHLDIGLAKPAKKVAKDQEVKGRPKSDFFRIPKIAFVAGNKIYQIDVA